MTEEAAPSFEFKQGWLAYMSGVGWSANPYVDHSPWGCMDSDEVEGWNNGFHAARDFFKGKSREQMFSLIRMSTLVSRLSF